MCRRRRGGRFTLELWETYVFKKDSLFHTHPRYFHTLLVNVQLPDSATQDDMDLDLQGCDDETSGWVPVWRPMLLFMNEYSELTQWCAKYVISNPQNGTVEAKLGYRGEFYDVLELQRFPFDRQVTTSVNTCQTAWYSVTLLLVD